MYSYVSQGIDANATDLDGVPLVSLAASNGHVQCIKVLVELGALVNSVHKSTGNTALHQAVLAAHIDCVETLLG